MHSDAFSLKTSSHSWYSLGTISSIGIFSFWLCSWADEVSFGSTVDHCFDVNSGFCSNWNCSLVVDSSFPFCNKHCWAKHSEFLGIKSHSPVNIYIIWRVDVQHACCSPFQKSFPLLLRSSSCSSLFMAQMYLATSFASGFFEYDWFRI